MKALPEIEHVLGVRSLRGCGRPSRRKTGLTGRHYTRQSRLRTVVVVSMSVRWPLLGGASGWFDGGLFCQLRMREKVSKLEGREDLTET